MASSSVITLSAIQEFFGDYFPNALKRGENALASGHLLSFTYDGDFNHIEATVKPSMRPHPYTVRVDFNRTTVLDAHCSCTRGLVGCHHIAAVLLHTNKNVSCTDANCRWSVKNKQRSDGWEPVENLCAKSNPMKKACIEPPTKETVSACIDRLKQLPGKQAASWIWLLSPEEIVADNKLIIKQPKEVICSDAFAGASDKLSFLFEKLGLSWSEISNIADMTVGQATNRLWFECRKWRLTASKFGDIISAYKRNAKRIRVSLLKALYCPPNLERIQATMWGRDHEKVARDAFCKVHAKTVSPTGIWLHTCGFLGASPDGLIDTDSILEVKCPFKFRNCDLEEVLSTDTKYFATFLDGEWKVDKNHPYFHQIQGQLYLSRRQLCHFVMWTTKSTVVLRIPIEPAWEENLHILQKCYVEHFIPYAIEHVKQQSE